MFRIRIQANWLNVKRLGLRWKYVRDGRLPQNERQYGQVGTESQIAEGDFGMLGLGVEICLAIDWPCDPASSIDWRCDPPNYG